MRLVKIFLLILLILAVVYGIGWWFFRIKMMGVPNFEKDNKAVLVNLPCRCGNNDIEQKCLYRHKKENLEVEVKKAEENYSKSDCSRFGCTFGPMQQRIEYCSTLTGWMRKIFFLED